MVDPPPKEEHEGTTSPVRRRTRGDSAWKRLIEGSAFQEPSEQMRRKLKSKKAAASEKMLQIFLFCARLVRAIVMPCCGGNEAVKKMSVYEEQAKLARFDLPTGLSGVIPKYMTLVIQIGYIILFAPAFPLAAPICLLSNIWRIRADACLLLYNTQRPPFRCAQDIGTLRSALRAISILAVATHVGVLVFTSRQLHDLLPLRIFGLLISADDKFTLLVVLEHAFLGFQFILHHLLQEFLPATPKLTSIWKAVEEHRKRAAEDEQEQEERANAASPTKRAMENGKAMNALL